MRKFIQFALLALALYAAPAYAQTDPEISQEKVAQAAKPFLGTWDGVSCDSRQHPDGSVKPYGLRFNIRVDSVPDQDNGTRLAPILKLLAVEPDESGKVVPEKPFDFQTVGFYQLPGDSPNTYRTAFLAANPNLLVALSLPNGSDSKSGPNIVHGLEGQVKIFLDGTQFPLYAIKESETMPAQKDQWLYVKTLSMLCPATDNDDQNEARLQRVAFSTDDTDGDIDAAIKEFNQFADDHSNVIDFAALGRTEVGQPWFARFYHFNDNGDPTAWEEEGYPHILDVVVAIERDFITHPEGYSGKYEEGSKL
jgi:hypothetical protein